MGVKAGKSDDFEVEKKWVFKISDNIEKAI